MFEVFTKCADETCASTSTHTVKYNSLSWSMLTTGCLMNKRSIPWSRDAFSIFQQYTTDNWEHTALTLGWHRECLFPQEIFT